MTVALRAAFRLQLQIIRRIPDYLTHQVTSPLLTMVFLLIVRQSGRTELVPFAVVGPVLIGLWATSLFIAGEIITGDRGSGVFEALVATPAPLPMLVLGRVGATTLLGLVTFAETWFVVVVIMRQPLPLPHPAVFLAALAATAAAMAGHAVLMAATFVLGESSRPFQRALSWPFYLLGGVMVPIALLPGWVQPLSRGVFLSWGGGLLRDALKPGTVADVGPRLALVLLLGAIAFTAGCLLTNRMVARARSIGTMTYA